MERPVRINLTPIDPLLLTAYVRGGRGSTRRNGRLVPDSEVLTVKEAPATGWRLARDNAKALLELDHAVAVAGGARIRLVDCYRDPRIQSEARRYYENWLRAGKPDPSSNTFVRKTMKAAYVARAGESNHGWGGSIDIDVEALAFPGTGRGTDQALATFWGIAMDDGWRPAISQPRAEQSEAWHFDRYGPMEDIGSMFMRHGDTTPKYLRPYPIVATVGCLLASTMPVGTRPLDEKHVQAMLLAGGFWCGEPDGAIGPMTRKALEEAGIPGIQRATPVSIILAAINEKRVGYELLEAM